MPKLHMLLPPVLVGLLITNVPPSQSVPLKVVQADSWDLSLSSEEYLIENAIYEPLEEKFASEALESECMFRRAEAPSVYTYALNYEAVFTALADAKGVNNANSTDAGGECGQADVQLLSDSVSGVQTTNVPALSPATNTTNTVRKPSAFAKAFRTFRHWCVQVGPILNVAVAIATLLLMFCL